ncbi:thioesterase domain-containing protein [Vibrio sp. Of7-15]|uniref:thioesterase II family protein n=1 Tax=Vibrio sp. Of7-15 TaxID=2724879 RepID=UPI001EF2A3B2|nr:alpha/beta fold hydrolase [Vibrio sp. Of7-15]MCG7495639.1 thioesterase domain-containing protein [Vibrio sp. Of7-15]
MEKKITLIAIPFAGGSGHATYSKWGAHFEQHIALHSVEYAGHGHRMSQPRCEDMQETVDDTLSQILPIARKGPYALYAHSMGCAVAYEVIKALKSMGVNDPEHLFLSGRKPPHMPVLTRYHTLSDDDFLNEIRKIDGTPDDFFKMKELVDIFLPVLRSDYRILENYVMEEPRFISQSDITFFFSEEDSMLTIDMAKAWEGYTEGNFSLYRFGRGHFFINEHYQDICTVINDKLKQNKLSAAA